MSDNQAVENLVASVSSSNIIIPEKDIKILSNNSDYNNKNQSRTYTTLSSSSSSSSPPPPPPTVSRFNRLGSKNISFKLNDDDDDKRRNSKLIISENNLNSLNENITNFIDKDINMDDSENYRIRQFNTTKKGTIINRGDSFKASLRRSMRSRNSKSLSVKSSSSTTRIEKNEFLSQNEDRAFILDKDENNKQTVNLNKNNVCYLNNSSLFSVSSQFGASDAIDTYFVCMLGASSVGKSALIKQFETSEYRGIYQIRPSITPFNATDEEENSEAISIMLDDIESHIYFKSFDIDLVKSDMSLIENKNELEGIDGYIVVYSICDKQSFHKAFEILDNLIYFEKTDLPIILVGNKSDLVRKRFIKREDGKALAKKRSCKFVETSVAINDKVDDLLAGILKQIRLNKSNVFSEDYKNINKPNIESDLAISSMTEDQEKKDTKFHSSNIKKLSLMKKTSFFKKLYNTVFKKKTTQVNSDSVENLFTPVPTSPCEILKD